MSLSGLFGCHQFHRFFKPRHERFVGFGHHFGHRQNHGFRGHEYRHPFKSHGNHHRGWLF